MKFCIFLKVRIFSPTPLHVHACGDAADMTEAHPGHVVIDGHLRQPPGGPVEWTEGAIGGHLDNASAITAAFTHAQWVDAVRAWCAAFQRVQGAEVALYCGNPLTFAAAQAVLHIWRSRIAPQRVDSFGPAPDPA